MWPEACTRRFVSSPITETVPNSFSRVRRIDPVSSDTVSTLRTASAGNSSPNSHWDFPVLAMFRTITPVARGERCRNALNTRGAAGHFVDLDHGALQEDALTGDVEPP